MTGKRGSALFNTLVVVSLLCLAAFFLAASTTSQLQLTAGVLQRAQVEQAAQATLQEVLLRFRSQPPVSPLSSQGSLLALLRDREVLLAPSPRLPVTGRVLLDRCVDNSSNPEAVASAFDGPGRRSVPPFALSLALEITYQGRVSRFEGIIQQRWPYVVTAPGPILVGGAVPSSVEKTLTLPSLVKGRVLALANGAVPAEADQPIYLSPDLYRVLAPATSWRGDEFRVAGSKEGYRVEIGGQLNKDAALAAKLDGGVDMVENGRSDQLNDEVKVYKDNYLTGSVRKDYRFQAGPSDSPEAKEFFASLFVKPETGAWPPFMVDVDDASLNFDRTTIPGGKARISGRTTRLTRADILLQDVQLGVDGDFVLVGCKLRGSGASLIVDGTLILDGGELDAGDNGLVLYCRRLIMRSSGHFRGIIIARQGAYFNGDGTEQLTVEGGLLVGRNSFSVDRADLQKQETDPQAHSINGLVLSSTTFLYAPRYLRSLNRFAPFEVLGLERRP